MSLENKAGELLVQLIEKSTQAGDFIAEQAPLVIQELLTYNFTISLLEFVFRLIVTVGAWYGSYKFFKHGMVKGGCQTIIRKHDLQPLMFFAPILAMILTVWSFCNLEWLKIWLAPRVYLLEYAAGLVK